MAYDWFGNETIPLAGNDLPFISVVMSGGSGSRLWPLSREDKPKQFHALHGEHSLLHQTLCRLTAPEGLVSRLFLVGAAAHQALLRETVAGLATVAGVDNTDADIQILLEPMARNTAAVAALAAGLALQDYDDALVLLCPADHDISTTQQFWNTVRQGVFAARQGAIVTFGIVPDYAETGYGYIQSGMPAFHGYDIAGFAEKPERLQAQSYLESGDFYWNSGIFLFRASALRQAFLVHDAPTWHRTSEALQNRHAASSEVHLPVASYALIQPQSFDCAIMEKTAHGVVIPAMFHWSDLGSWQALLTAGQHTQQQDDQGNILIGNVIAQDCNNSYIRSESGLLSVSGLSNMAVIATKSATYVGSVGQSSSIKNMVARLAAEKRPELFYAVNTREDAAQAEKIRSWLFDKAAPLWAAKGIDLKNGGFHERLTFSATPLTGPRRSRTIARQIYAFARLQMAGWHTGGDDPVAHGLRFMQASGRSEKGGWVSCFDAEGRVSAAVENLYDQSCMLLALAWAYQLGHHDAQVLGQETFAFLDHDMAHPMGGYYETPTAHGQDEQIMLTSNAHMHLLEACLAWHEATGQQIYLSRAGKIAQLCEQYFFDREYWCLGEYFTSGWQPAYGDKGEHTEPGHHFEWAALLADYAERSGDTQMYQLARRLYSTAIVSGINRNTGLVYNSVRRDGRPADTGSRSWQQCEALKAAIALDGYKGLDLQAEIEARVAQLFHWHLEPVMSGLWVDKIDAAGTSASGYVPASIFYHLIFTLTQYLDYAGHDIAPIDRTFSGTDHGKAGAVDLMVRDALE